MFHNFLSRDENIKTVCNSYFKKKTLRELTDSQLDMFSRRHFEDMAYTEKGNIVIYLVDICSENTTFRFFVISIFLMSSRILLSAPKFYLSAQFSLIVQKDLSAKKKMRAHKFASALEEFF